ncbi:efflux RND transporter periplasmic adaptor subunit [Paenibacillus glycanilyticus]|uniref:efflux RND transporter periplasmic adaptor subunit n=1 Tax=Paenibacillus glycanilyticus TaxID=126569 RepID=UPI00203D29EF|nr:efflux RND transporter periplasmic adaptor subunit [Paenibacillus glycanilyticus]MCM3627938.1 efflux RND transporter periplasmic adaptor subunit [Paenibacillus glycanilyticus]
MLKLRNSSLAMSLIVSMSLLAGCSLIPAEEEPLKPPLVKPAEQNYSTEQVKMGDIRREVKGSGVFESTASELAQFKAQGGRLKKLYVSSGDTVKKGDVLAELAVDGLDVQTLEQKLGLERADFALKQAKKGGNEQEIHIAQLQLEIEQLKLDKLEQTAEQSKLRATMNGQVVFVEDIAEGDFVQPYQTLVRVADPSKLRFSYRSSDAGSIGEVQVGMSAVVTAGNNYEAIGKVVQTPSSAPLTTDADLKAKYSSTLYVNIDKLPEDAEIGSSANVSIVLVEHKNVVLIPKSGLRSYLGRTFVRVLDGKALREVDVEVGIQSSTEVEIARGLKEGQTIVLN